MKNKKQTHSSKKEENIALSSGGLLNFDFGEHLNYKNKNTPTTKVITNFTIKISPPFNL